MTGILELIVSVGLWLSGAAAPLSGHVVDAATGQPVAEARLDLRTARVNVRSDSQGAFSFGDRSVELDTLLVTHPAYLEARVLVRDLPAAELRLRVALTRRRSEVSDTAAVRAILRQARELAERHEGHLWERQDFLAHAGDAQSPLELLPFSGFVERVITFERDWCVRLPGGDGCAAVWVDGEAGGQARLLDRFPAEVGAFVIVPPERAGSDGVVILFLLERDP